MNERQGARPPLWGKRVLVTRAPERTVGIRDALEAMGAMIEEVPTIEYAEADDLSIAADAVRKADTFDYVIFTSVTAVNALRRTVNELHVSFWQNRARFFAVGPATGDALEETGVRGVSVAPGPGATGVIKLLQAEPLSGKRVLLPRAQDGKDDLRQWLEEQGAVVTLAPVYRTVLAPAASQRLRAAFADRVDVITFTSPSTVEGFLAAAGSDFARPPRMVVACIGPTTAHAAELAGLVPDIVPPEATAAALAAAISDYFASHVFS